MLNKLNMEKIKNKYLVVDILIRSEDETDPKNYQEYQAYRLGIRTLS